MMVLPLARYSAIPRPERNEKLLFQIFALSDRASISPFCPWTIVV